MADNDTHEPKNNHEDEEAKSRDDDIKEQKEIYPPDTAMIKKLDGRPSAYLGPFQQDLILNRFAGEMEAAARSNTKRRNLYRGIIVGAVAIGAIALVVVMLLLSR